jgi:hypothetical protein
VSFQLFQLPKQQNVGPNLVPLASAKAYFYATGTSTAQDTYSDSTLETEHDHPVVADTAGRFPAIYLDPLLVYKVVITTASGVEIYEADPCNDQIALQSLTPLQMGTIAAETEDVTFNIPSDYDTLQEALDTLSVIQCKQGVRIILNIESGHSLTEGVTVASGDYSRFRIEAEDSVSTTGNTDGSTAVITGVADTSGFDVGDDVYVTHGFDGYGPFEIQSKTASTITLDASSDAAWTGVRISTAITVDDSFTGTLFSIQSAKGPELNCLINLNGRGDFGAEVNRCSEWSVQPGAGVINSGDIGIELRSSRVTAISTFWGGADDVGVRLEQSSIATFNSSNVDNCGGINVFVSRACSLNFLQASACNAGKGRDGNLNTANSYGIEVRRSIAAVASSDFSGAVSHGVFGRHTALIGARESLANDCGGSGYRAEDASIIGAQTSSATGCSEGYYSIDTSSVDAESGDASGHTGLYALRVDRGGFLHASSCTTDTGTPGVADCTNTPNTYTRSGAITDINAGNFLSADQNRTYEVDLADDAATSITLPGSGTARAFLVAIASDTNTAAGLVHMRVTNVAVNEIAVGSTLSATTGALTGTTGVDGEVTVSVHSDGKLYVENRSGSARRVGLTIMSAMRFT